MSSDTALHVVDQNEKEKRFYWNSKKVSKKVYNQRLKQQALAKSIRSRNAEKHVSHHDSSEANPNRTLEGRRIVHIDTLAKKMFCNNCKSKLHLSNIIHEKQYGLASIFYIKCDECKGICTVPSDKKHVNNSNQKRFDTNVKAVIGLYILYMFV